MYVITGASGNTGHVAAEKLLAQGARVRAIGRDPQKLERLTEKGAELFIADLADADALTHAFTGATAAYVMIPPNPSAADVLGYQERVSDALATAIVKSGVPHVVALSSIGADKPEKTGPVVGLFELETKLNGILGLHGLYVRAGYFMENTMAQVGVIQSFGVVAGPLRADLPLPLIATQDIGAAVADALVKRNFEGKVTRELLGARDVTYSEIAKILGEAIERPGLGYKQFPAMMLKPALTQLGMSPNMADLLLEMSEALNEGYMKALEPRSAQNTTPTTFEQFAKEVFAPAYRAKAARA
jgi:uncharacterized protein YbjT (DUF2867 family)